MKRITFLLIALTFLIINNSLSQSIVVRTNQGNFIKNARSAGQKIKINSKNPQEIVIIYEEGYITKGLTAENILDSCDNKSEFIIKNLRKVDIPNNQAQLTSKKIAFTKYFDPTGKLTSDTYYTVYYFSGVSEGIDFNDKIFARSFISLLNKWGYKTIEEGNSVFREKTATPDLAVAGEILESAKETKGTPGFKVSVWVKWSIFDVFKEKVIYEVKTAGYSDTRNRNKFKDELVFALEDAAQGLINDNGFKKIAIDKTSSKYGTSEAIALSSVTSEPFNNYGEMIKNAIKSSITVKTEYGHGSGFIISSDGYAITNYHVISDASEIEIIFHNNLKLPAEVISYNGKRDVALLKITGAGFTPMAIKTSNSITGTEVIAIGTPNDISLGQSITKGVISGNRTLDEKTYIQTDVSINKGNSGGALVNMNGEVVGIIVQKIIGEDIEGLGFAIPIEEAINALNIKFE